MWLRRTQDTRKKKNKNTHKTAIPPKSDRIIAFFRSNNCQYLLVCTRAHQVFKAQHLIIILVNLFLVVQFGIKCLDNKCVFFLIFIAKLTNVPTTTIKPKTKTNRLRRKEIVFQQIIHEGTTLTISHTHKIAH